MAYVGTARNLGNPRDTLASIIQGEAGGQGLIGMQAVGAVINNRAQSNFNGWGTDPIGQATQRMQFQGQATPGADAYAVADAVLAGNNPDPTGGATYYANPGASSAAWARNLDGSNSLKIGSHYFTDNTNGVPFAGNGATDPNAPNVLGPDGQAWNLPPDAAGVPYSDWSRGGSYGAGGAAGGAGAGDPTDPNWTGPDISNLPQAGGGVTAPPLDALSGGGAGTTAGGFGSGGSNFQDPGAAADAAGVPAGSGFTINGENFDPAGAQSDIGATFSGATTAGVVPIGSPTVPLAIDRQSQQIAKAATTEATATKGLAQSVTSSSSLLASTATSLVDKIDAGTKNLFVRGAAILVGVIFLAGALYLLGQEQGGGNVAHA